MNTRHAGKGMKAPVGDGGMTARIAFLFFAITGIFGGWMLAMDWPYAEATLAVSLISLFVAFQALIAGILMMCCKPKKTEDLKNEPDNRTASR